MFCSRNPESAILFHELFKIQYSFVSLFLILNLLMYIVPLVLVLLRLLFTGCCTSVTFANFPIHRLFSGTVSRTLSLLENKIQAGKPHRRGRIFFGRFDTVTTLITKRIRRWELQITESHFKSCLFVCCMMSVQLFFTRLPNYLLFFFFFEKFRFIEYLCPLIDRYREHRRWLNTFTTNLFASVCRQLIN